MVSTLRRIQMAERMAKEEVFDQNDFSKNTAGLI